MEIKQLRIRYGWCQSELAKKLNTTLEHIQEVEIGKASLSWDQKMLLEQLFFESELSHIDLIQSSYNDIEKDIPR